MLPAAATAAPDCRAVTFAGTVRAGEPFARAVGNGLVLELTPAKFFDGQAATLDGWLLQLVAERAPPQLDHIYPVNPPLRFNPWQDIGTSYGVTAAEKLQRTITYRFVLTAADLERISPLLEGALWPYSTPHPENAGESYLSALEAMTTGVIRFRPIEYELGAAGKSIRHLDFEVRVVAPDSFDFASGLAPVPTPCAEKSD